MLETNLSVLLLSMLRYQIYHMLFPALFVLLRSLNPMQARDL